MTDDALSYEDSSLVVKVETIDSDELSISSALQ